MKGDAGEVESVTISYTDRLPEWQQAAVDLVKHQVAASNGKLEFRDLTKAAKSELSAYSKEKRLMPYLKEQFELAVGGTADEAVVIKDEKELLEQNCEYMRLALGLS